jgi:hypothetical protein
MFYRNGTKETLIADNECPQIILIKTDTDGPNLINTLINALKKIQVKSRRLVQQYLNILSAIDHPCTTLLVKLIQYSPKCL